MEDKDDVTKKVNIGIWKNFFKYLRPYKKRFMFLISLNIGLGFLDSTFPMFTRYAVDNFIANKSFEGLPLFIFIYLLAVGLLSLIIFLFIKYAGELENQMAYDLRKKGFLKLQELSLSYYDNKAVGWLMARMTSDITRLSETISWGLVDFSWGITVMIGVTIYMFILSPKLAIITLLVVPPLALISFYFQRKILNAQRRVRKINSEITGAYNEDIQGAKTTKTLVREDLNLKEFSELTSSYKRSSIRATIISSIYIPIVITIASIGTALAVVNGGHEFLAGVITYGTLFAFITYTGQFFEPVMQMAAILADMQIAQASAERVFQLLEEEPAIKDSPEVIEKYGGLTNLRKDLLPEIKGDVEFRNVSFSYKEGEPVLKNFNLKVSAGQTIALVGETGSGKSTIVNLFCRFYEPTEGEIFIDGINYKDMPIKWIHENLGYVLQAPHLFSGTIKENVRYGKLDATDEEIIEACKLVDAHKFIIQMEKGYDTEVGEGGGLLSTGQKQLISFARAIVRNPRLFVLDEATSSIDTETELIIQRAINKVLKGRTSFVIAHRLSTIKNADRILVIHDGEVIEEGTHKELIRNKGYYYKLYTNQFIEEKSTLEFEK